MRLKFVGKSDVGKKREKNEDSFLIKPEHRFCVVADGMGGHLGGEYASKLAVKIVDQILSHLESDPDTTIEEGAEVKPGDFQSYLRYALTTASGRIFEKSKQEVKLKGMGTTTVIALFRKNLVYVANVGDSRAYRIRDGEIEQITQDHSLVGEQVRAGILTVDDAKGHRLKNIITRSVGFQESVDADINIRATSVNDIYLLCSDGLSNLVENHEIRDIVLQNTMEAACSQLIDLANQRGGDDNITIVLAKVETLEEAPSEEETIEV